MFDLNCLIGMSDRQSQVAFIRHVQRTGITAGIESRIDSQRTQLMGIGPDSYRGIHSGCACSQDIGSFSLIIAHIQNKIR